MWTARWLLGREKVLRGASASRVCPRRENWSDVIHPLGVSENSSSSILNQLQLSDGFFREAREDTITIVESTEDKCLDTFF